MAAPSVALVAGVTGMVGLSLVDILNQPASATELVYGIARRPLDDDVKSQVANKLDEFIQLDMLDRDATFEALSPVAGRVTHLYWVALAERGDDHATAAANSAMLTNVLDALMTGSAGSSLRHVAVQTGTKHYYWGLLITGQQGKVNLRTPFRESSPRDSCKLFYYDLEDILVNYSDKVTWSVHRSSLIMGASDRSMYNVLLTLAAYASICKHEGEPFVFPGSPYTWQHFCDVSDAELLAKQQVWAGTTSAAKNQAFNCTNGDVFTWRSFWKVLCEEFGLEFVEEGLDGERRSEWIGRMMGKGNVWEEIARENGLKETRLLEVTCFPSLWYILNFEFQHVSCMNKSRAFVFVEGVDSLGSVRKWVAKLRETNIIPKV